MSDNPDGGDPQAVEKPKTGIELAREALAQAKADARERGAQPGQGRRRRPRPARATRRGGDPTAFGPAIRELLAARGWEERAAVGGVFGRWPQIVGPELAEHTVPRTFEDGVLVVAADSTNWATQLRLLLPVLHASIDQAIGTGVVTRIRILGPAAPDWSAGPRRVKGRGPRDTYG